MQCEEWPVRQYGARPGPVAGPPLVALTAADLASVFGELFPVTAPGGAVHFVGVAPTGDATDPAECRARGLTRTRGWSLTLRLDDGEDCTLALAALPATDAEGLFVVDGRDVVLEVEAGERPMLQALRKDVERLVRTIGERLSAEPIEDLATLKAVVAKTGSAVAPLLGSGRAIDVTMLNPLARFAAVGRPAALAACVPFHDGGDSAGEALLARARVPVAAEPPLVATGAEVARLGCNLRVALGRVEPWTEGGGAVVSERLVREGGLTVVRRETLVADVHPTEQLTRELPGCETTGLDPDGLIRVGESVRAGDLLVGMTRTDPEGEAHNESLLVPSGVAGRVIEVRRYRREAGDPLPEGVVEQVQVVLEIHRPLASGDLLGTRHGQRFVVAAIVPDEVLPTLDDVPVDLVFDPAEGAHEGLLLELALGRAAGAGRFRAVGARPADVADAVRELPSLPQPAGVLYVLRLRPAADVCHARATGPYSLITQQPLGGRRRYGGQRVDEALIGALVERGAAVNLQELLTVKSDDVIGRELTQRALRVEGPDVVAFVPRSLSIAARELDALLFDLQGSWSEASQARPEPLRPVDELRSLRLSLMGPDAVRAPSRGEVRTPETINYRSLRPEPGGLFCPAIFGPERDFECACGGLSGAELAGEVCGQCGVEIAHSRVRASWTGHIDLVSVCVHPWFWQREPCCIGELLGLEREALERVIYYVDHLVLEPGPSGLRRGQTVDEEQLMALQREHGEAFETDMGGQAIQRLLADVDPEQLPDCETARWLTAGDRRPEWMCLTALPVLPPDLRPVVRLSSGNFASSDLNDLYRRLINRNNRTRKLIELNAPDVIVRNERRMLQQAVDALLDNARCKRSVVGVGGRPLKSLTDLLAGPQGRLRENLNGKRVDFSARAVVAPSDGPVDVCGLPLAMALELFSLQLTARLGDPAAALIREADPRAVEALEALLPEHPVLVAADPPPDRMGVVACTPRIAPGDAVELAPAVAHAMGLTFAGAEVVVHLPLSRAARREARALMPSAPERPRAHTRVDVARSFLAEAATGDTVRVLVEAGLSCAVDRLETPAACIMTGKRISSDNQPTADRRLP